jgi:hypothetical protein
MVRKKSYKEDVNECPVFLLVERILPHSGEKKATISIKKKNQTDIGRKESRDAGSRCIMDLVQ